MKKKILALCLVVVLAATAIIGGTLAYFTDTDEATNTFTVGNLDIELEEPSWNPDGDAALVTPGASIAKDPTITVLKGSVDCYVRAVVTMPTYLYEASDFYHVNADARVTFDDMSADYTFAGTKVEGVNTVIVLQYIDKVSAADAAFELDPLFTSVNFAADLSNVKEDGEYVDELYKALAGGDWDIKVEAYAVQADNVASADAAFNAAFSAVFPIPAA